MKTVPLASRKHLVDVKSFGKRVGNSRFIDSLPKILAANELRRLIIAIQDARNRGKSIIWACGGHVIKTGCSPYLNDLMRHGFLTHLALNGAGAIHDWEIAFCGQTSEDVAESISDGSFGMAEETSVILNKEMTSIRAIRHGLGNAIGRHISDSDFEFKKYSLLREAYDCNKSTSIHVALGTDVTHSHPACDWSRVARAAQRDFDHFVNAVTNLNDGGVYINVGSAVLLPEVFLKAVSSIRNHGLPLQNFTAAVLDMQDHYRPRENVLKRPGGRAIKLIGHHEIMIPLIVSALFDE